MSTLAERATAMAEQSRQRDQQKRDQRDSTPSTQAVETTLVAPASDPLRSAWWSVHHWGGWPAQAVFTDPAATYAEMRHIYPQAAGIVPVES